MTYVTLLMFLVFRIQAVWASLPVQQNEFSIDKVRVYAEFIMPYCIENGFCTGDEPLTIEMRNIKVKLPQYAQIVRSGLEPVEVFEVLSTLQTPPPFWRAGTDRCSGLMIFNPQWKSKNFPFYGSPGWRETLAHEISHIGQGCDGNSDTTHVEWSATIMGLEMLASMDRDLYPGAYVALVEAVRGMAIGATIEHLAFTGGDAEGFVWSLDFSQDLSIRRNFRRYWFTWVDWCENSPDVCRTHSERYWRGPLLRMLNGYESIPFAANKDNEIIIDDLFPLLTQWFGLECTGRYCSD